MDEEQAFLREIESVPDEDDPRKIFSDWLEDRGDPRAEFIRLQCDAASSDSLMNETSRREQECRVRDLLEDHREAWLAPVRASLGPDLAGRIEDFRFVRGFVAEVCLTGLDFLNSAPRLFDAIPLLEGICLTDVRGIIERLAGSSWLTRIRNLRLCGTGLGNLGMAALARSRHLSRLSRLQLQQNGIGSPGMEELAGSDRFPELTCLDLSGNVLGDGGLQTLARWSRLEQLVELDLSANSLTDEETADFVERLSRRPSRLAYLGLRGNSLQAAAARALRKSASSLHALCGLDLSDTMLGTDGAQALSEARFEQVHELNAAQARLTVAAVQFLIRAFPRLRRLSLAENTEIGDAGVAALIELGLPREALSLAGTRIGDAALMRLAGSPGLATLEELDLRNTLVGPAGLKVLLGSPHCQRLRSLAISGPEVGAEGAGALAGCPRLQDLRELFVEGVNLGPAGTRRLAESAWLNGLKRLSLQAGGIGDGGLRTLLNSGSLGKLRELNLSRCRITDEGAELLAMSSRMDWVTRLDLSSNELGDGGIRALVFSPHLSRLAELNLMGNPLSDDAAAALVSSPYLSRIRRLTLPAGGVGPYRLEALRRRFGGRVIVGRGW